MIYFVVSDDICCPPIYDPFWCDRECGSKVRCHCRQVGPREVHKVWRCPPLTQGIHLLNQLHPRPPSWLHSHHSTPGSEPTHHTLPLHISKAKAKTNSNVVNSKGQYFEYNDFRYFKHMQYFTPELFGFFSSYDFQTCKTVCWKIAFTLALSISRLKFNQRGKFSPLSSPHADTSQPPTQLLQQPILAQELVQPTNPMSWSVELTFGSILELTQPTISPSNRSREILKLNCDHCTKKDCFKHQLQLSFFFTRLVDFLWSSMVFQEL